MRFKKITLLIGFFAVLLTSLFPQNTYLLVLFSGLAWILLPYRKWWDGVCMGLLLFSIFYAVMVVLSGQMRSGFLTISYLISPVAFYRFGQYLLTEYRTDNERFMLLLSILFGYLLNVFILTFVDIAVVGIVNEDRTLLGASTGDDALAATLYGLMASVGIGYIGACFAKEHKLVVRIFFCILVVLSLLIVIHLVNRGGLVVFIISLICSIFINYRKSVGKLLFAIIILTIGVLMLLNLEVLSEDILEAYERRNEFKGYGVESVGGRTDLWMMSIENMFRNPMGWKQDAYAHNMWLDISRIGGWISLLPFLSATVMILRKMLSLYKNKISNFTSTLVVLNLALIIAASIEPVIEGSMLFFSLMMMFWGMISHMIIETKWSKNGEDYNIK